MCKKQMTKFLGPLCKFHFQSDEQNFLSFILWLQRINYSKKKRDFQKKSVVAYL